MTCKSLTDIACEVETPEMVQVVLHRPVGHPQPSRHGCSGKTPDVQHNTLAEVSDAKQASSQGSASLLQHTAGVQMYELNPWCDVTLTVV